MCVNFCASVMNMDGFSLMLTVSVWDARHTESQTKRAEEHEQAQCMCALQTTTAHSVVSLTAGYKAPSPHSKGVEQIHDER